MSPPRVLLMIDAGFLLKALTLEVGAKDRTAVAFDYAPISDVLADVAEENTGARPIRQVWYDAARDARPNDGHKALAAIPGVAVRLGWTVKLTDGRVKQKAVDTLIVRDLLRAAYQRSADTIVLLAGDGDLVPGVHEAADHGLVIHLWGVASTDQRIQQSPELISLADRRLTLALADLLPFVRPKTPSAATAAASVGTAPAAPGGVSPDTAGCEGTGAATEPVPVDVAEPEAGAPPPSLLAVPPPVATGAPSLRQLSTPDAFAEDQLTDQIDEVSAEEAGRRYGNRWLERIDPDVLARFLNTTKRPTVPPRIDKDLLGYLLARGIDHQGQDARRAARNGFWDALEATAATR